jgi:hypothetical protein
MTEAAQKTNVESYYFIGPHLSAIIAGRNVARYLVLCLEQTRKQIEKRSFYPILSGSLRTRGRIGRPLSASARDELLPMIVRAEIALYTHFPEHGTEIREGTRALAAQVSRLAERDGVEELSDRLALVDVNARAEILESVARIIDNRALLTRHANQARAAGRANAGAPNRGA